MDIKKLKYDLSMQCAMIDILKLHPEETHSPDFDLRTYILDKFESYYRHFDALHDSRWEVFKDLDQDKSY